MFYRNIFRFLSSKSIKPESKSYLKKMKKARRADHNQNLASLLTVVNDDVINK